MLPRIPPLLYHMKKEVKLFVAGAEAYAQWASRLKYSDRSEAELVELHAQNLVHYIFPNAVESERTALVSLWKACRRVTRMIREQQRSGAKAEEDARREFERLLTDSETAYVLARHAVFSSALTDKVDVVQEEILESPIFTVPIER